MPQLLSRRDDAGWLTPAMAEVLDEVPVLNQDEKDRREQAMIIQRRLSESGAPGRIVRVGVFPSHTLFVLQVGDARQRSGDAQEIAHHLPALKEALGAEAVELVPAIRRMPEHIGIFVRMADHPGLRLRNLLLLPAFLAAAEHTALALGLDLDQQVVVRNLAALPHLLILGDEEGGRRALYSLLVNLALFNTPAEVRIALMNLAAGASAEALALFARLPHVLGQRLRPAGESLKLLEGLVKECTRRAELLQRQQAADLESYQAQVRGQVDRALPRIVVVMEDFLDPDWLALRQRWQEPLRELATAGPAVGVHLIAMAYMGSGRKAPRSLRELVPTQVILPTVADPKRLWPHSTPFPAPFVDGFLLERSAEITPLAFGGVSDGEVARVVDYWQAAAVQRSSESPPSALTTRDIERFLEEPAGGDTAEVGASPARMPTPPLPSSAALARATEFLTPEDLKLARARALTAYLGWLGYGPLHDVLGLSEEEATGILARLQEEGVLETGDGPIWRFVRLDGGESPA